VFPPFLIFVEFVLRALNCKKELQEYGAILLSPPKKDKTVEKFHLYRLCYQELIATSASPFHLAEPIPEKSPYRHVGATFLGDDAFGS
jgi:hypothetical protein